MNIGDRMKSYEALAESKLMDQLPCIVRIDGRSFHTFTKGLEKPYDIGLSKAMIYTTKYLVENFNANIGYTQSDEISLLFEQSSYESQMMFGGRVQKLTSILSSATTLIFNKLIPIYLPTKLEWPAMFDCRVFNTPNREEAINYFIWRERDAIKNSVSMLAQANFSHKELQGKNGDDMQELLFKQRAINYNNYPSFFKRGTFVQPYTITSRITKEELEWLPEKHEAKNNPNFEYTRKKIMVLEAPDLSKIVNKEDFLFYQKIGYSGMMTMGSRERTEKDWLIKTED